MTIRWTLLAGPPPAAEAPEWLGPAERRTLASLRFPKRRSDWLLGRYAAKRVVARLLAEGSGIEMPLDAFDILAEPSGAPFVRLPEDGIASPGVTISHSEGRAFCAAWETGDGGASVGVDLEKISTRSSALVRDFFRPEEIAAWEALPPGGARDALATAIWSAKEAVLKALRLGLAVDTRTVRIRLSEDEAAGLPRPDGSGWKQFEALLGAELPESGRALAGFWREEDGFVLTMAVAGPSRAGERRAA
jgi:4'-phosphopantetheinyl transferase